MWVPLPGVEEDCQELGVTDTSATFVVVRFTGATVAGKEVEWWVLLQVRDGVTGPTFTAAQFSGAISTTVTRRLESFLPPTLLLLCSLSRSFSRQDPGGRRSPQKHEKFNTAPTPCHSSGGLRGLCEQTKYTSPYQVYTLKYIIIL